MKINTTSVKQEANAVLGTETKNLYYLIIENNIGKKLVVNVGQKTHDQVQQLIATESVPEKLTTPKKPQFRLKTGNQNILHTVETGVPIRGKSTYTKTSTLIKNKQYERTTQKWNNIYNRN